MFSTYHVRWITIIILCHDKYDHHQTSFDWYYGLPRSTLMFCCRTLTRSYTYRLNPALLTIWITLCDHLVIWALMIPKIHLLGYQIFIATIFSRHFRPISIVSIDLFRAPASIDSWMNSSDIIGHLQSHDLVSLSPNTDAYAFIHVESLDQTVSLINYQKKLSK